MVARAVLLVALGVGTAALAAEPLEGTGRLSLIAGWRYTPNDYFDQTAAAAGYPSLKASPGGPMLNGSFSYAATDLVEVSLELFGGGEQLRLATLGTVDSYTYGAMIGIHLQWLFQPAVWPRGLIPYLGIYSGPTVIDISPPAQPLDETVVNAYAAGAGLVVRLSERIGLCLDLKVMLARGQVANIGGVNGGGLWAGVGIAWLFPRDASDQRMGIDAPDHIR